MRKELNSKILQDFNNLFNNIKVQYEVNVELMKNEDKLTQDILHKFELGGIDRNEQSRLTTRLKTSRKDRRYYKDRVEELQPLIDFMNDEQNQKTLNRLKNLVGQVKKQESYHANRTYVPRVLKNSKTNK